MINWGSAGVTLLPLASQYTSDLFNGYICYMIPVESGFIIMRSSDSSTKSIASEPLEATLSLTLLSLLILPIFRLLLPEFRCRRELVVFYRVSGFVFLRPIDGSDCEKFKGAVAFMGSLPDQFDCLACPREFGMVSGNLTKLRLNRLPAVIPSLFMILMLRWLISGV